MGKTKLAEPAASRAAAGQSQKAAAELLQVHYRTWQNWEAGNTDMPPALLLVYRHLAGLERIPFRSVEYARPEVVA